jgi:hypothetical protein
MNRPIYYIFLIATVLFFSSCSSGERNDLSPADSEKKISMPARTSGPSADDDETSYSLTVNPKIAFKGTVFQASSKNFKLSDARIQWTLNNFPIPGAVGIEFNAEEAVKGDIIQATAMTGKSKVESNTVAIRNSKPEISSVMFLPVVFKPGDRLYVDVSASDPDGDKLSMLYEWTSNLEPAGSDMHIDSELKRGDRVVVKITPYDGQDYGEPFIVRRDIQNMPVTIMENREFSFDGETFTHKANAFDPDGDKLLYSLEDKPEGMTINPETGIITWPVPRDFIGEAKMTVSVSDGFGGKSTQELSFTLTLEEEKVSQGEE